MNEASIKQTPETNGTLDLAKRSREAIETASKQNSFEGMSSAKTGLVLEKYRDLIEKALPKHLTADRIIAITTEVITRNSAIAKCSPASLIGAVMQASILGFQPTQALGQCYFVPYGGHVQFQIGYKGYIDLAYRSKNVKMIYAAPVLKGDDFYYEYGLHPKLEHKPTRDRSGELEFVYAVVHFTSGDALPWVLTREEVEDLRKRNSFQKNGIKGPWETDYNTMAMAKAVKAIMRFIPMSESSPEAAGAPQSDEAVIVPESFAAGGAGVITDDLMQFDQQPEAVSINDKRKNSSKE